MDETAATPSKPDGLPGFMHFLESQLFINFLGFLACFLV
jgi:hypothetical protein